MVSAAFFVWDTEKTVKEFQSAHGLTADGIAGAKTKVALAKQL